MRSHSSIRYLILIVSMIAGAGCAARDSRHTSLRMGDYRQLLEKRQSQTLPTNESAQNQTPITAEEYQRIGDQYFLHNDLAMAFANYDKALYLEPSQVELSYKKGLIFLKRGLAEEAIREFQIVLETNNSSALAYQGMGQALLLMRDVPEAEKQFRHALHFDASLYKSYNFLGIIYDHQKRFDEAITAYKTSISLKQGDAALWNNLGVSYYKSGDYNNAAQAFERASTMAGDSAQAYNNLGLSLAKLGNYQEALNALTKGGNSAKAYNNLGVVYLAEERYKEATIAFEKAMALSPRHYPEASENLNRVRQALQRTLSR